jgi:hypothetical protein
MGVAFDESRQAQRLENPKCRGARQAHGARQRMNRRALAAIELCEHLEPAAQGADGPGELSG